MSFEKILIIDDESIVRKTLQNHLKRRQYKVTGVKGLAEGEDSLQQDQYDMVFLDLRLPDGSGIDLLENYAKKPDSPLIVVMTGYGSVESAVDCMRAGAFDYVIKPFSGNQIDVIIRKAESYRRILNMAHYFREDELSESRLLGNSEAMLNVKRLIQHVAPTQATVLIHGESGTGKELVASEIHRASQRSHAPFVRVNCAAISETLIESEFFGHEKGAFTGASSRRIGRFELADEGTILLDEISEISPGLQAKLLRVLQEKEFERVGGNSTIKANVRVLATTNRNLQRSVEKGDFREDLYYRLNVFPIKNPALRDRFSDIPILAEAFMKQVARKHGVFIKGFTSEAMDALLAHDWPGNVRELQNTVERAVILSVNRDLLYPDVLGLTAPLVLARGSRLGMDAEAGPPMSPDPYTDEKSGAGSFSLGDDIVPLRDLEKKAILHALEVTKGNRTRAANALGISIRNMRNKIRAYRDEGIDVPDKLKKEDI